MKLNRNNLLIWEGNFGSAPIFVTANNDNISVSKNTAALVIDVLSNDVATLGILRTSVVITENPNTNKPAVVDAATGNIVYYPPAGFIGQHILKYRFRDMLGNPSNEGTVTVVVQEREVSWRIYPPSFVCERSGTNDFTGNGYYRQLQKFYPDTQEAFSPQELVNNTSDHPNYVPPAPEPTCAIGSSEYSIQIMNNYSKSLQVMNSGGFIVKTLSGNSGTTYTDPDGLILHGVGYNPPDSNGDGGTIVPVWVYDPAVYDPSDPTTYVKTYLASEQELPLSVPHGFYVEVSINKPLMIS